MKTYSTKAKARLSMFSLSKFVVGSSKARIPQLRQNVSANASLIIKEASTYNIVIISSVITYSDIFITQKILH